MDSMNGGNMYYQREYQLLKEDHDPWSQPDSSYKPDFAFCFHANGYYSLAVFSILSLHVSA
jgi:hypothetical protein